MSKQLSLKVIEVWVGNITYIPLVPSRSKSRFGYLALLMDLFSRRIVCWSYDLSIDDTLVLGALTRAIREWQPAADLIHHTDRGGQDASGRYRAVLRRAGVRQSVSAEALGELSGYIRYDNADRLHSSPGFRG